MYAQKWKLSALGHLLHDSKERLCLLVMAFVYMSKRVLDTDVSSPNHWLLPILKQKQALAQTLKGDSYALSALAVIGESSLRG